MTELKLRSFYIDLIAEFVATLLFLYVVISTVVGQKEQTGPCDGVGHLLVAWAFGGMTSSLFTALLAWVHQPGDIRAIFGKEGELEQGNGVHDRPVLGAICGVGLVKASYILLRGGANAVAPSYSTSAALGVEIIVTFVLVYTVLSATEPKRRAHDSPVPGLAPLAIGFAVFTVHLATIPITDTGINLARSFGATVIYNTATSGLTKYSLPLPTSLNQALLHE
ncbi:hypothetical protein NL676_026696 [Syzygium grande]|nr:hypothetical protein NL676_026696 [Syzygium grande]